MKKNHTAILMNQNNENVLKGIKKASFSGLCRENIYGEKKWSTAPGRLVGSKEPRSSAIQNKDSSSKSLVSGGKLREKVALP